MKKTKLIKNKLLYLRLKYKQLHDYFKTFQNGQKHPNTAF